MPTLFLLPYAGKLSLFPGANQRIMRLSYKRKKRIAVQAVPARSMQNCTLKQKTPLRTIRSGIRETSEEYCALQQRSLRNAAAGNCARFPRASSSQIQDFSTSFSLNDPLAQGKKLVPIWMQGYRNLLGKSRIGHNCFECTNSLFSSHH